MRLTRPATSSARALEERIVAAAVALAVVAVAVESVAHIANETILGERVDAFDVDAEGQPPAWANSVAIFAAGFASSIYALVVDGARRQWSAALAALLAFLSLDEIVQIHERLGKSIGRRVLPSAPDFVEVRFWLVIYLPLLLVTLLLLLRASREADEQPRRSIEWGVGLLVGAVAMEGLGLITKWLEDHGTDAPDVLRIVVEEGAELGGWVLCTGGLTALALAAAFRASEPGIAADTLRSPE